MKDVQSPTFAFHNVYDNSSLKMHHVDLYRLDSEEDLESTGFWDLFENEDDVMFVEWSNLIHDEAWPCGWKRIDIEIKKLDSGAREITIKN
jgi:tRNA threonylcarbamoyladenosine biosynthesis protein TsaE